MRKLYSVWARQGESIGHTLVEGEGPLQFLNGEVDEECEVCLYIFKACTFEEAMSIYYLRQGWAPYKPIGVASPCPTCGSNYFPEGSGECWKCELNRQNA